MSRSISRFILCVVAMSHALLASAGDEVTQPSPKDGGFVVERSAGDDAEEPATADQPWSNHLYLAEIHKTHGCVLPMDPTSQQPGECKVVGKSYQTGVRLIRDGHVCMKEYQSLVKMHLLENTDVEYFAPELKVERMRVPCKLLNEKSSYREMPDAVQP